MSSPPDLERRLADWLDDQAPKREPDGLTYAVLARTRRTRRMPRWASPERWHPLTVITRPALAPPLRIAWLLILAVLVAALAGGVAIVGSRVLIAPKQAGMPAVASIPQGGAAVLAFDSNGDIFTVRADGTDLRQLTSGPDLERTPSWSPDGTRLAYLSWTAPGTESLVVMDAGGGNRATLVTTDAPNEYCLGTSQAAWSPDATSIVVPTSEGCDSRYDVVIVAADGSSQATRLVAPGVESVSAAWSPDGTQIAFQGRDEVTGKTGLYVIDLGEGDALKGGFQGRRVGEGRAPTQFDPWSVPRWSPDGTELASVSGEICSAVGNAGVIIVKADGSGQRALAAGPTGEYDPAWSPDGKQIALHRTVEPSEYWNDRPCTVRTWIVAADGTNERRLDALENDWPPPLWSPDGTRLVGGLIDPPAEADETNPFHLSIFTVDGSSPPVTLGHAGLVSWQPVVAPLPPAPSFAAASSAP
jgi:TolB protein